MGSLPKSSLSTTRRLWKWVVILLEWDREGYSHADHAKEELPYCYVKTQVEEQRPGIHSVWQILNKSSWERGFGHGCVYKTELVDLAEKGEDNLVFGVLPGDPKVMDKLDTVGLPPIGAVLQYGDPFYSYINTGQSFVNF